MARVTATVAAFNSGRTSENGFYAISIATPYRRYYALWRIFADERPPLFIRTLADTFVMAAGKAMDLLKYCKVTLKWVDNTFFIPYYEQTYDTLPLRKIPGQTHRGSLLHRPELRPVDGQPLRAGKEKAPETERNRTMFRRGTRGTQPPATACLPFA